MTRSLGRSSVRRQFSHRCLSWLCFAAVAALWQQGCAARPNPAAARTPARGHPDAAALASAGVAIRSLQPRLERILGDGEFTRLSEYDLWAFSAEPDRIVVAPSPDELAQVDARTGIVIGPVAKAPAYEDIPKSNSGTETEHARTLVAGPAGAVVGGLIQSVWWPSAWAGAHEPQRIPVQAPLAMSPTSDSYIIAARESRLVVWDLNQKRERCALIPPGAFGSDVTGVRLSTDGKLVVVCHRSRFMVWTAQDCTLLGAGSADRIDHVGVDTKAARITIWRHDSFRVQEFTYGGVSVRSQAVLAPTAFPSRLDESVLSPDGHWIAFERGSRVLIASTGSGPDPREVDVLPPGDSVQRMVFSPDGRRVLCVGKKRVNVLHTDTGKTAVNWPADPLDEPALLVFSDQGRFALSDKTHIRVYDLGTGAQVATVPIGAVGGLEFTRDGKALVGVAGATFSVRAGESAETAFKWDLGRRAPVWEQRFPSGVVLPGGGHLVHWVKEGVQPLRSGLVVDGNTGESMGTLSSLPAGSRLLALGERSVLLVPPQGPPVVRDVRSPDKIEPAAGLESESIVAIRLPLFLSQRDGRLMVGDARTPRVLRPLALGTALAALSPATGLVAWVSAQERETLHVETIDGKIAWSQTGARPVSGLAFDPAGNRLAVARASDVEVWSLVDSGSKGKVR
jgi:WD40 repeat protein